MAAAQEPADLEVEIMIKIVGALFVIFVGGPAQRVPPKSGQRRPERSPQRPPSTGLPVSIGSAGF